MTWRKFLVRCLVFSGLGALLLGGGMYALWTNPAAVRQLVQEQLGNRFVRVSVQIGYARIRLLGGILVKELRIARTDGLDSADFLYVPSAIIYHDKEHILEGKVLIRKIELTSPQFRLVRDRDGKFNLAGILGPVTEGERLPTVVIRNGTILLEDRAASLGSPLLEIRNVNLTLINDPLTTLQIEGGGETDVLGPIHFHATVSRANLTAKIHLDLTTIPVGDVLLRRVSALCPEATSWVDQLTGKARVRADIEIQNGNPSPDKYRPEQEPRRVSYDVSAHFEQGRCAHSSLPLPLEQIELDARCVNGLIPEAKLSAANGQTRLTARVADFQIPRGKDNLADFHKLMRELDVSVEHLEATTAILDRLPEHLRFIRTDYSPSGPISVSYTYRRAGDGPTRKEWLVQPEGMDGEFKNFRYPLHEIRGKIVVDTSASPIRNISLDLTGLADNRPINVKGTIKGEKLTTEVILDIRGEDILLDDRILQALPEKALKCAMQFLPEESRRRGLGVHPMGKADFHAAIRRSAGQTDLEKRYTVIFKESALEYDQFPYPLENVSGVLIIHPDHWECKNFRGTHLGGEFIVTGRSERFNDRAGALAPDGKEGPKPQIVRLRISGRNILLDRELERALSPRGEKERKELQNTWRMLALAGRLNFTAEVVDHPNHPKDIDVTVDVQGCTMKPTFFDFALTDVSGTVRYAGGQVYLRDILARHGPARLGLRTGLIELKSGGGFLAWLRGISGQNILPDRELLSALPERFRKGLGTLRLSQPLDVSTSLTIDAPPGVSATFKVWWDGGMRLTDASFQSGVSVTGATGQFCFRGYHDGRQLRGVFGDLVLTNARILGQPITNLHARLEILPDSPDVARIRDIKMSLFDGTIGGEARLDLGPTPRYDVLLEGLGIQLEQFGRHNLGESASKAQLEGPIQAALHLQGVGSDVSGLKGNGRLDVAKGKMGQLPALLDLMKAFGLRVPDRTAFEQANMIFSIEGPQVRVQQLDLYGNAVSLRGTGLVDLDGDNLELDFTATPGLLVKLLPTGIDAIPPWISQQILKIKMRGKVGKGGDLRFEKDLVPGVVDPLRRVIGAE